MLIIQGYYPYITKLEPDKSIKRGILGGYEFSAPQED